MPLPSTPSNITSKARRRAEKGRSVASACLCVHVQSCMCLDVCASVSACACVCACVCIHQCVQVPVFVTSFCLKLSCVLSSIVTCHAFVKKCNCAGICARVQHYTFEACILQHMVRVGLKLLKLAMTRYNYRFPGRYAQKTSMLEQLWHV
jgi:hypothetical protein